MIGHPWTSALQFAGVKLLPFEEWPQYWMKHDTKPGYILLQKGDYGTVGGLLRLTKEGVFLTVSKEQVFDSALIEWPGRNRSFTGIKITGDKIEIIYE